MKKVLIFSLLLYSGLCIAQVQTRFYKNDVKTVEYLTLNFCVDSTGKTSEVTIIESKTSYSNKDFIAEVVKYRKGVEYFPDTKLKNNCYDQMFEFINPKYENKILSSEQCNTCKIYRKGKYRYRNPNYSDVKIIRRKHRQIEKSEEGRYIYKIDWITDCEYNLTYLKVSEKKYEYLLGETINVKIIDIMENGNYIYESNLLDRTIVIGEMSKL